MESQVLVSRGFPAVSMSSFLKDIWYPGGKRKKIVERIGKTAEDTSRSIWKASHYKEWCQRKLKKQ